MDSKRRRGKRGPFGGSGVPRKAHGKSPAVPLRPAAGAVRPPDPPLAAPAAATPAPPPSPPPPAPAPPQPAAPPLPRAAAPELTAYGSSPPSRRWRRRMPVPVADPTLRPPRPARERLWPAALVLLLALAAAGGAAYHWRDRLLPPPPAPSDSLAALGAADAELSEIRSLLRQLDFAPGPDGAPLDDATRAAIRQYQQLAGEPETGEPSAALLEELRQVAAPMQR